MPEKGNLYHRRGEVIGFASSHAGGVPEAEPALEGLDACFRAAPEHRPVCSDEAIQEIMERMGKGNPEDQLNCGACGYLSCRAQAIAVLEGMAVPEMCIPHMRRLAEQRTDKIVETTPSGVVILDASLRVLHMNPAFRRMFECNDAVLGKHISYLMDPAPFERLAAGELTQIELTARHPVAHLVCQELLYTLQEERQYVGIFMNLTHGAAAQEQLLRLRSETLERARELMEHQTQMAQQMAQYLGESSAQSEELLRNIVSIVREKPKAAGDHWLWGTDTTT
jgi:PAS domain-containing protein